MQSWTQEWLCLMMAIVLLFLNAGPSTAQHLTHLERLAYCDYYPSFVANSTSSPSGPFPSNDNSVPPAGPSPTVPVYISSLSATENWFHVSLLGRESARHHQCLNNPYRRKGESETLPNCKGAREPTLLQSPVLQLLYRIRLLSSKNLLM